MQLDSLEATLVEGRAVPTDEMYDGMVLMSKSGYPLLIKLNPLRVNNIILSPTQRNWHFKNGYFHILEKYTYPLAPWQNKSNFDILVETNEKRNGDLSVFISLLKASTDLSSQLQLVAGDFQATTIFAPTNEALATLDPSLTVPVGAQYEINATLKLVIQNHFLSGNFARRCWWITVPLCANATFSDIDLQSEAGYALNLTMHDVVKINGDATILQEDLFSEQGVVHVIDKPLLLAQ